MSHPVPSQQTLAAGLSSDGFRSIGGGPSALAVSYDRHLGLAQPSTRRCLPDFESPMLPATRLALALREKIAVLGL